jgi:hypothetical protein
MTDDSAGVGPVERGVRPACPEREEIEELRAQVEAWRKHCDTLTHQVICCGVAASHPDATLTTRGAYAGKWNSAQAEEVRKLRAERDSFRADAERFRWLAERTAASGLERWVHPFQFLAEAVDERMKAGATSCD